MTLMSGIIDIRSRGTYPANVLSNYYPNRFSIDGVTCESFEGFLQSLKFRSAKKQSSVCKLIGSDAEKAGGKKWVWKLTGNVYWRGVKIKRNSEEFDFLIKRAYNCLAENKMFANALRYSQGKQLVNSMAGSDKRESILTEDECIDNLNRLRDYIKPWI